MTVINKCYNNTRVHEQSLINVIITQEVHDQSLINVIITQEFMNSH